MTSKIFDDAYRRATGISVGEVRRMPSSERRALLIATKRIEEPTDDIGAEFDRYLDVRERGFFGMVLDIGSCFYHALGTVFARGHVIA